MSGLANRLVTAAAEAIDKAEDVPPEEFFGRDLYRRSGAAAAVAVLRALAESGQVAWAESLAGLAEVIEKGEQDGHDHVGSLSRSRMPTRGIRRRVVLGWLP